MGWRNVARICEVNGSPAGKMELIAGVRGCVLEGPQAGAAAARAAKATAAYFIEIMATLSRLVGKIHEDGPQNSEEA
jgi:hypothetical protein